MRRRRFVFVFALAGLISAGSFPLRSAQTPPGAASEFVTLAVTVTDSKGRAVAGLARDDFALFEEDQKREIAEFEAAAPLSLTILLDVSPAMFRPGNMLAVRPHLIDFVSRRGADDELLLIEFSHGLHRSHDWTNDRTRIHAALSAANERSYNFLPLLGYNGMYDALGAALPVAAAGRHPRKALLVLSAGSHYSNAVPANVIRRSLRETDLTLYALALDPAAVAARNAPRAALSVLMGVPPSLETFAYETGGRTWTVSPGDVRQALEVLSTELDGQYLLRYRTSAAADGPRPAVRVVARGGALHVRNRRSSLRHRTSAPPER